MEPRNTDWMNELQRGISDLIAKSPAADLEKNVRAMMTQTFARMDLITREEFDTQVALLERALERVQALEDRVAALEQAAADNVADDQETL
ncbi:MAG TPA: accessory factor UbiK family protein [Paenalcaligenes sp.]|nr:accessory factor UbiK family protein [Paenalcaligenes sp.]